jgi:peptide/nickel transport system substrate-binding protein/oligopeptide transport system substrate-binding protein
MGVLKGWDDAIAGTIPTDQIGVTLGASDYELVLETVVPAPFIPSMMLYSLPLSKAGLETHGPLYNTKPETHITSGPFKLEEWTPDVRIVAVKNPDYKGLLTVPVNKIICNFAAPSTWFSLYQTDQIDFMEGPAPQELAIAQQDEKMSQELFSGVGPFRTFYLFFDVTKAPFDDLRVRQAFSHVIDRDALVASVLGPNGVAAYSFLAPGFPAANGEALSGIQSYDVAKGQQLLADAGFPNGEGFPKLEMWLRNEPTINQNLAAAMASMIKEALGIEVEVSNRDNALFMAALTAKPTEIPFGLVSYGMDFFDPSNMLSVFKTGGRHSWSNADYDAKLAEASSFLGDPAERLEMFKGVEQILVEDVPAVFIYHQKSIQLIKPWLRGDFKQPDVNGIAAMHWPYYTSMSTVSSELYVGNDAPSRE